MWHGAKVLVYNGGSCSGASYCCLETIPIFALWAGMMRLHFVTLDHKVKPQVNPRIVAVQTPNSIDKTFQHGIPSTQCLISDGKMQSPLLGKKTEHILMSAWPVVL